MTEQNLREFLRTEARKSEHRPYDPDKYWGERPIEGYAEDVNEDALTNAWLDKSTSYIYKVGCLTLFDDNKRDFGWAFVGIERDPGDFQYLGSLYFRDGENTDCGRVMRRVLACLAGCDIVFQED